jgi:hypothetical protein
MMLMQNSPGAISLRIAALALFAVLGASGCGVKGPLQPAPKTPPVAETPVPAGASEAPRERKQ